MSVTGQAIKDHKDGLGVDACPFPVGSQERADYIMERNRLVYEECKREFEELKAGV